MIFNGFQPLTIAAKFSLLDVCENPIDASEAEHISHLSLVFLLLTLSTMNFTAGYFVKLAAFRGGVSILR